MIVLPNTCNLIPLNEEETLSFPCSPAPLVEEETPSPVVIYNWAHTRALSYAPIASPSSIEELIRIIKINLKIRPIGSLLTYEALTKSEDGILLNVSSLPRGLISITDESAEFWAGTTVEQISDALIERGGYFDTSPGVVCFPLL
jgi:hypothetical protein